MTFVFIVSSLQSHVIHVLHHYTCDKIYGQIWLMPRLRTADLFEKLTVGPDFRHPGQDTDAQMLLTIKTTHQPAADLGFLLHKHPEHLHDREFAFGNATVFYPEVTETACTAAILLDVDPVGM